MTGRNARTIKVDNEVSKLSNKEIETLEELTPVCESQNFIAPKSLNKSEKVIWDDLVKILKSIHGSYISDADIMTMEIYCKNKAEYDKACKDWEKNPEMYIKVGSGNYEFDGTEKIQLKTNPAYTIKRDFSKIMLQYLDQLGISPLGRARQGRQATNNKKQEAREALMKIFDRTED
jgi:P27 family predicted phage terminase small subunit